MIDWNQPDSHDTLRLWLLNDPLTLFQAVMLTFGRDPSNELTGRPNGYAAMAIAMKQAIERGELRAERMPNPNSLHSDAVYSLDYDDKVLVRQADVRKWLRAIDQRNAFFFLAGQNDWPTTGKSASKPTADKPLDTRERTTLLCIIGALAANANLDLSQPMKAGDAIAAMMPGVKLSGRAIGEHLKAVRDAMDSRKG